MKENFFSWHTWLMRFKYPLKGLGLFFKTEHNAWVYLFSTIAVCSVSLVKTVSKNEAIILVMVTVLVWICELFNTAIEQMADVVSPQFDRRIGKVKDLAAAAVLLSAVAALITGLIIFIPKFI